MWSKTLAHSGTSRPSRAKGEAGEGGTSAQQHVRTLRPLISRPPSSLTSRSRGRWRADRHGNTARDHQFLNGGAGVTAQGEIMHVRQSRSLEISSFLMSMWTSCPLLSDFTHQVWRRDSPGILTLPRRHAAVALVCPSSNSSPTSPSPSPQMSQLATEVVMSSTGHVRHECS